MRLWQFPAGNTIDLLTPISDVFVNNFSYLNKILFVGPSILL